MRYRVSSSIENFKPGLRRKYPNWKEWNWFVRYEPTVFFGMYHIGDVARLLWHLGKQTVFWCGSDILNMQKSPVLLFIVQGCNARHVCENEVERKALEEMGIYAEVKPQLFDVVACQSTQRKWEGRKQVYLSAHNERLLEYGVSQILEVAPRFPDIDFHFYGINLDAVPATIAYDCFFYTNVFARSRVSHEQFLREITNYHCAVRLNEFDGFSEVLARSALLGQYQISRIPYLHMFTAKDTHDLITSLKMLELVKEPNIKGQTYWLNKLSEKL